ncbi:MAG: hypothetical protein DCF25_13160 [Leptolyngbya foveolarum]|uniref:Uncharacterized protein n=1 Tax=Leptolyngbya foveolarum TaxID=47253 RepID=A0A2W4U470_9CYAN|nr:MAG: hypothetical protein DCF25_13160 [Leptolyngbya foveolarum]
MKRLTEAIRADIMMMRLFDSEMATLMTQQLSELIQRAEDLSESEQLKLIAHLVGKIRSSRSSLGAQTLEDLPEKTDTSSSIQSILQLARDFTKDLSEEGLARLPHDGALEHDHYIYGTPKQYS